MSKAQSSIPIYIEREVPKSFLCFSSLIAVWLTELQVFVKKDEGFCEIPHTTVPQLFSEFAP